VHYQTILYERRGPVATITLNRPQVLNALSVELIGEVSDALDRIEADEAVRAVVLMGAGRAFSAGYDLKESGEQPVTGVVEWRKRLERDVRFTLRFWDCPKPVIAAVHGYCLAGGLDLAMCCDITLAAEGTLFGEPEIRFGSGPVTLLMPFVLGQKKTNELLYTGDAIEAKEAERIGLVNRVVPAEELESAVGELVRKIAPTPLPVLRLTKIALTRAYEAMGLRQAVSLNLENSAILNTVDTPEQREFNEIAKEKGLKAALAWRDARYGEALG